MKRLAFFLSLVFLSGMFFTALSAESLLKQFEGHWMIINTNSAVVDRDFIAIGEFKGYRTVSICFIAKVVKAKDYFSITCNPRPTKAEKENAAKILSDQEQPWDDMNEKNILKTGMKLFPTKDGFKLSEDGKEYWKM